MAASNNSYSNRRDKPSRQSHGRDGDPHGRRKRKRSTPPETSKPLPLDARHLFKHELPQFRTLFASYLDIQKNIDIEELEEHEVKGRWKSFVSKWNGGELAEGWYDPETLLKTKSQAAEAAAAAAAAASRENRYQASFQDRASTTHDRRQPLTSISAEPESEDEVGPSRMDWARTTVGSSKPQGPSKPTFQDLELKRELAAEEAEEERQALRAERKVHNKVEKERLEDIQPRAEAGTHERRVEKRREIASSNRAFANSKEGGGMAEVPDADLMGGGGGGGGGGDDSLDSYKRQKREHERKKNEREVRREEMMMARRAEREERARRFREREANTMKDLVQLAKQRFG